MSSGEQREQQQDAIEALRGNSGRRGAAAVDAARVDASVDERRLGGHYCP